MYKECVTCKTNYLINNENFYIQKKKSKKRGEYYYCPPECKQCTIKRSTKYNKEHPEVLYAADMKRNESEERQQYLLDLSRERRKNGKYRDWQRINPEKSKTYRDNRAHKEHDISSEEWLKCKQYFNFECAYCGLNIEQHNIRRLDKDIKSDFHKEHVDHEGSNDLSNCIPSCITCNSSKRQMKLEEWYNPSKIFFSADRLTKIHKWLESDHKLYIRKIKNVSQC